MEHNNQNKNIQQQLHELQSLPDGIHFNSAAAWDKIEAGLQPKVKRSLARWYLAAASVVICCLLFLFIEKKSSVKTLSGTLQANKDTIDLKAKPVAASTTLNGVAAAKKVMLKKTGLAFPGKNDDRDSSIKNNAAVADQQALQQQVLTAIQLITPELPAKIDTSASTILAVNKKTGTPKLKIVHLNELGEAVEMINETEKSKLSTAWFFSNKTQVYDNSSQLALPSKKPMFTITLSSKNNN